MPFIPGEAMPGRREVRPILQAMWLRLKQIALVARKLAPVEDELADIFGIEVCYRDREVALFGLENALFPIGNQLLEVVAPVEEDTAAGRYLERRGGEGGYMVITQCSDPAWRNARVEALGLRLALSFQTDEFDNAQLHPKDTGGSFFEIDWQRGGEAPDGPWRPAGPDWQSHRRLDVVSGIPAAEIQSPDPEALARRWSEITQIDVERAGDAFELSLENARVRFVPAKDGRPEGLGGIDVSCVDRERCLAQADARGRRAGDDLVIVCGTRFRLV